MGHTAPDGTLMGLMSTIYALQDMAELAVRGGSIVSFDRRGNVIWLDDFEDSLARWAIDAVGTGAGVVRSITAVRSGRYSCRLTTAEEGGSEADITHGFAVPVVGGLGVEVSFAIPATAPLLTVLLTLADATGYYEAGVRYSPANDRLQILGTSGAWTPLTSSLVLRESQYGFNTLKMVADFVNHNYLYLVVNEESYPVSSLALNSVSLPGTPYGQVIIRIKSEAAGNQLAYVDDVIVTQNES